MQSEVTSSTDGGSLSVPSGQLLLWFFLAGVTMLFAAFASAYLVRRGGPDWQHVALPGVVWANTAILLASSGTLEVARRSKLKLELHTLRTNGARVRSSSFSLLAVTTALGVLFLLGQILTWHQLAARGVFLPTNPHASFFYILTGVHAAHLLGGLAYLGWALARPGSGLNGVATYWHFLGAVWIGLLVLVSTL
jgi:cytochrome c oxidase subunit 3